MNTYTTPQSRFTHFFTADTASAPFWLLVRLYLWLVLALGITLAHRVAGHWGLDRYARPFLQRKFRK